MAKTESKRGWKEWLMFTIVPALVLQIPAGPSYLEYYKEWRYDLKSGKVEESEKLYKMSIRNTQCLQDKEPTTAELADGRSMSTVMCPSGDILRSVYGPRPDSPRIDAWFGIDERMEPVEKKTSWAFIQDLTAVPQKDKLKPVKKVCAYTTDDLVREIWKWSDGKCYLNERLIRHRSQVPPKVVKCDMSCAPK